MGSWCQSPAFLDNTCVTYADVTFKTERYLRNAFCITKKEEEGAEKKVKKKKKRKNKKKNKKKHIHQKLQLLMACSKFYFNLICCMAYCLMHCKCSIVFASPCRAIGLKQRRDAPILAQSVKSWPVWPVPQLSGLRKIYWMCGVSAAD